MTNTRFDFARYEPHWCEHWERTGTYQVRNDAARPFMVVPMFPYPSGKLHVGHVRNYTIGDVQARYWRRRGYDVMHPIGWDAFGLPAENAAIKTGVHPEEHTRRNIADMAAQLKAAGMGYDWSREVAACDESYYRWTQWLFIQLYKHGLAYKANAPVNWCPTCQTALANEQVVNGPAPTQSTADEPTGVCERCGTRVIARNLEQWFFRTTAFADDLLEGLDALADWPEHVKTQQRHWIGKADDGTYRLHDWLVSRQRYWGAPIPMVSCPACGTVPVPEEQLPVRLPRAVDFTPKGEPPLASNQAFVETTCPACGGPARREVETMDTFVDSSWYLYRYLSPQDAERPFDPAAAARWLPVDIYVGGAEHSILHLMYARFVTRALQQMGFVAHAEPARKLFTLGMVFLNGAKMSKSKGNVVSQDEMVRRYGADTLRLWEMFMAPPGQQIEWSTSGIEGCHRFLRRIFSLVDAPFVPAPSPGSERARQRTIARVTEAIETFRYNSAIALLMEFTATVELAPWHEGVATLVDLVAPFAPFAAEEIHHRWGRKGSVHHAPWPTYDPTLIREESVTIPVQVAGRLKGAITVSADATQADVERAITTDAKLREATAGRAVRVFVPGRIINFE